MIRCLADLHHDDLYRSLQYLFEGRLGWRLYRPIGMEWFTQGYWNLAQPYGNHPSTVAQYLSTDYVPDSDDPTPSLNSTTNERDEDGVRLIRNAYKQDLPHRAITLEQFKSLDFSIVIASVPYQVPAFRKLIADFKPQAKLILQMGNNWGNIDFQQCQNILASTAPFPVPAGVNAVFYHQEFDLSIFRYTPPESSNVTVQSFLNYLPQTPDYPLFCQLRDQLPEYRFKSYGAGCEDGTLTARTELWEQQNQSMFIWHVKAGGDGFGHVLFNAAATGRPTIVKKQYYRGQLGEKLMEHRFNCFDLSSEPLSELISFLRRIKDDAGFHRQMCQNAYNRFKQTVNFDSEELQIRAFLEKLV